MNEKQHSPHLGRTVDVFQDDSSSFSATITRTTADGGVELLVRGKKVVLTPDSPGWIRTDSRVKLRLSNDTWLQPWAVSLDLLKEPSEPSAASEPAPVPEHATGADGGLGDHISPYVTHVVGAYADIAERVHRLSQTSGILGAFLIYNKQIVMGGCANNSLDKDALCIALCRLSQVLDILKDPYTQEEEKELQTVLGEQRLVVYSLGETASGFQIGAVVRPHSPVCKSLQRLLRQIDRAFTKTRAGRVDTTLEQPTSPAPAQVATPRAECQADEPSPAAPALAQAE